MSLKYNPSLKLGLDRDTNLGNTDLVVTSNRTVTGSSNLFFNTTSSSLQFKNQGHGVDVVTTAVVLTNSAASTRIVLGTAGTGIVITDTLGGLGLKYNNRAVDEANIVWGTDLDHIPSIGAISEHIGLQDVNALVTTPTATEDGYAIVWDNTAGEYQLQVVGVSDGDKGDITVSSGGTSWIIDNGTITTTKMANFFANSILANNLGSSATPGYFNSSNLGGADLDNGGFLLGWTDTGAMRAMRADKVLGRSTRLNASNTSFTPNAGIYDLEGLTALAGNCTINAPAGTPVEGQKLVIKIKDDGTSRTLTWNAIFQVIGTTLPTATTIGKWHRIECEYNVTDTKWDVIDVKEQA